MTRARLTIDLDAVAANWRLLRELAAPAEVGAVVKADAYALGVELVARRLWAEGCRTFMVARLDEGLALRRILPEAAIWVLDGCALDDPRAFVDARLVPVLNTAEDAVAWRETGAGRPAVAHVCTGLTRLGLPVAELSVLDGLNLVGLMSHLACADETEHDLNTVQLIRFRELRERLHGVPASFVASAGMFLGPDYHFDLCRPGFALYGGNPTPHRANPMRPVVRLEAPIVQLRTIDAAGTVGYGAAHATVPGMRIATVPVGYADGFPRAAAFRATARIGDHEVPLAGRVSMDLITLDVTGVPLDAVRRGTMVDLLGEGGVDGLAAAAGTIGYEVLTGLGRRFERVYEGSAR